MNPKQSEITNSYVFQVELLVEGANNKAALEQLIHALNLGQFLDYRILEGIQLGNLISQRKEEATEQHSVPIPLPHSSKTDSNYAVSNSKSNKAEEDSSRLSDGFDSIRAYMKSNKLIRLIVNKGFGITLSIPCRIINVDEVLNVVTVYHVDEKQVYTFRLNEIEDFQE